MTSLFIFHHNDADGFAAGYLVKEYYQNHKDMDEFTTKLIEMDYMKEFPLNDINKDDIVYIVDYSINPEIMIQLLRITKNVFWIDHHISSINKYIEWEDLIREVNDNNRIKGIRCNGISGCELTWLYLFGGFKGQEESTPEAEYTDRYLRIASKNAPRFIKLIGDWDIWKHEYEETKPFIIALNTVLSLDTMDKLNRDLSYEYLDKLINLGKDYIFYRNSWSEQFRKRYGFETTIVNNDKVYSTYCLNLGNANSEYFGDLINKYDICITFCFNGKVFNYSMYSNKEYVNCAELCQYFGSTSKNPNGGGHKGAAGFTHERLVI